MGVRSSARGRAVLVRRGCLAGAAGALALASGGLASDLAPSRGAYRLPYADGTRVRVSHDAWDHRPRGRLDMSGLGGAAPYRIVAAADGVVRAIVDSHSERQDPDIARLCHNNYVWLEHPSGEWSKYSHLAPGSATAKARLKVGQFVAAGTYLGDEGEVGCATGRHLHFEVGEPKAGDAIIAVGGFLKDNALSKRNRNPRFCAAPGVLLRSGAVYVAQPLPAGLRRAGAGAEAGCEADAALVTRIDGWGAAGLPVRVGGDTRWPEGD